MGEGRRRELSDALLTCLDGVGDPEAYEGEWYGLALTEPPDGHPEPMLRDQFTDSYWAWRRLSVRRATAALCAQARTPARTP